MASVKLRFPLLLTFLASPLALAAAAPIDARIFAGKATAEPASFLIVLREQADLTGAERISDRTDRIRFVYDSLKARAEVSQRSLVERLRAAGVPFRSHYLVNMIEVEAPRSLAGELAAREDVASVAANRGARQAEPRRPASAEEISPLEAADVEPNIERIGAPAVWDRGFTGQGIVIGMADSGLTWDHPALKAHYRGFDGVGVSHDHNWHDSVHDPQPGNACGADSAAPCDDDGHGTSTASLAVGDPGIA
jgi:subtilisin family serine protease